MDVIPTHAIPRHVSTTHSYPEVTERHRSDHYDAHLESSDRTVADVGVQRRSAQVSESEGEGRWGSSSTIPRRNLATTPRSAEPTMTASATRASATTKTS